MIDEGVYGAFDWLLSGNSKPSLEVLKPRADDQTHRSVVYGPTCNSKDRVGEFQLPELFVGDTLFVSDVGSYTSASSNEFNGFDNTNRYYVCRE